MKYPSPRTCALLAGWLLLAGPLAAQDRKPTPEQLAAQLDKAKKAYEDGQRAASQGLARAIDQVILQLRKARMEPEIRAQRVLALEQSKNDLLSRGRLPKDDELLGAVFGYHVAVQRSYKQLDVAYNRLIDAYEKAGRRDKLADLLKDKEELDRQVSGQKQFRAGSVWRGTQVNSRNPADNVEVVLRVRERQGNTFKGTLVVNPRVAHAEFEVAGTLDGNCVTCNAQVVQGKAQLRAYSGFLFEDRMIAQFQGVGPRGRPCAGVARRQAPR
jgi:hypothetical protein